VTARSWGEDALIPILCGKTGSAGARSPRRCQSFGCLDFVPDYRVGSGQ
jgi:hypothetical protein